ncbi:MFS transporter [Wolbachia endosymbiont of Drosophila chauvacae]|jgi:predicted MFS family arabinose efflux permease|nr:MFS transporter [Wolbachia endosymbiont of Drosophila chauvacae]
MTTTTVGETPRHRTAPFGATATVVAATAIVVLSQLYGSIPLFGPVSAEFTTGEGTVAWVQTAFGIAYAAAFIAWGPVVDRFGPRRVMLTGQLALIVATVLASFAPTFVWLVIGRVVQGAVAASFAPAAFSYLGSRPAPGRRILSVTVLTSSFLASAVIGQVAAQVVTGSLDWRWFFRLSAVALVATALSVRLVFLPDPPTTGASGNPVTVLIRLLSRIPVLLLLVATMCILGPMIALYTAIGSSGLADGNALLVLRASALPALVWAPFGDRWLSRVAPRRRLTAALVLAAFAAGAVAVTSESVVGTGIAMFVVAGAAAVSAPAMIQTITGYAPGQRGSVTALYTCFLFLGASIAPSLVSAAAATLPATAVVAGLVSLAGALLVLSTRTTSTN